MTEIVRALDIRKSYRRGTKNIFALNGLSFDIRAGEFLSIVGRSGSGKSTLLNLLGGLDRVSEGSIRIKDKELSTMSRHELALHRRFTVGMVFQSFNLLPSRDAIDNVSMPMAFAGRPRRERKQRARELLDRVGLAERADHRPDELSGGEAQRVAIARALANDPEILLADEPTGNLDSTTSEEIMALLLQLNRELDSTIVMVSHDEAMARKVSDRVLRLHDGQITEEITDTR
ncbi:MAG: ABC transporter ATP-binding protein [Acidobacteria bacterium]|nr:ABC transporter ATP-binding protein [Acidobacteriota bacterium]